MATSIKHTAKSTIAAAIACALALGTSAVPALATTDPNTDDHKRIVNAQGMASDTAIEIVRVYFSIDRCMVLCPNCVPCDYQDHDCYEVSFMVPSWYDPFAGRQNGCITSYTAYVDIHTGEVLGSVAY